MLLLAISCFTSSDDLYDPVTWLSKFLVPSFFWMFKNPGSSSTRVRPESAASHVHPVSPHPYVRSGSSASISQHGSSAKFVDAASPNSLMENGVRSNGFRATREPSAAATSSGVVTKTTRLASGVNQSQHQSLNNGFSGHSTRPTSSRKQS